MNSQQKIVATTLSSHPINLFFHVDPIKYVGGHAVLELNLREEFSGDCSQSAGILGLVADYIARVAGSDSIGGCVVLEQEIFMHSQVLGRMLSASAQIEFIHSRNAAYRCKIYSVKRSKNSLVGESHGTLIST